MRILRAATPLLLLLTGSDLLRAAAPAFRDLMDPNWMPEPQRGMRVESATVKDGSVHIVTTGAELASEPNGTFLRVGVRSDNLIQANIAGDQRFIPGVEPAKWLWLRVRLSGRTGIIERSDDGKVFSRVCWFEHGGQMNANPESILVGKVPYHGRPEDYTEPGPVGSGLIGDLKTY
ncbi:MAG TPA: hypothetical protein PKY77_04580 [Phycisphaerae bacterium]|nr:hypothetical protein [Phycisphaerae bacterium]HRY67135.1 hypothetical protein [Phycisphaerae bacterium]HSA26496.1 hypothetical protein [Phycisphaerae bacterium]